MMRIHHDSGPAYTLDAVADVAGGVSAQPLYDSVDWYPGWEGFEHTGSTDGEGPTAFFGAILRGQAQGQVLVLPSDTSNLDILLGHNQPDNMIGLTLKQVDGVPSSGDAGDAAGTATTDIDGFYHTGTPAGRAGDISHHIGLTSQSEPAYNYDIPADDWWARHRRRVAFLRANGVHWAMTIDGPRQWLHVGQGNRVATYHLLNMTLLQRSDPHPVDQWVHLCHDPRPGGVLYLLGYVASTTTMILFRSTDGGMTLQELLSVVTNNAAIERDSERAFLYLAYTDSGSGNVYLRRSNDGGASWSTAAPCIDIVTTVAIPGLVVDLAQDARSAGRLKMIVQSAGGLTSKIFDSTDCGVNWKQILP